MTAVLSPSMHPEGLLQRRPSQHHFVQSMDSMGYMTNYAMPPRPMDANTHSTTIVGMTPRTFHMPPQDDILTNNFTKFQPDLSQVNFYPGSGNASHAFHGPADALTLDTSFGNTFNFTSIYNPPMNASMSAMPQLESTAGWYTGMYSVPHPMSASADMRNNSVPSSFSSSPIIKSEEEFSPLQPQTAFYDGSSSFSSHMDPNSSSNEADDEDSAAFSTDIDVLMRAIQAKTGQSEQQQHVVTHSDPYAPGLSHSAIRHSVDSRHEMSPTKGRKRYQCSMPDCNKSFYQKTHLEIHTRAHTGVKPFVCREPTCGQRFSQLGNLKTHERRHTGERPYRCDVCGKTFAQRGNVRAHKIVHTSAKPFTCKLDSCNKQFTQLGNLKSHQNKFHADTIRRLMQRFEKLDEGSVVNSWEREMWSYFGSLYKNCNKGIKGRGKDRRISNTGLDLVKQEAQQQYAMDPQGIVGPFDA